MTLQALRGTTDLFGEAARRWWALERTIRRLARLSGYEEVRTPILEEAALFLRSVGETTDIVQKEMFQFEDRGGHQIVLRPEGTAPIVRAYLEHHLDKTIGLAKLFYTGPMFRAERPQAGRYRQFHQYGVEAIGSSSPWVDVEVIVLCQQMLRHCGVEPIRVWLTSMGCRDDQARSAAQLRQRLAPHRDQLCKECQARMDKNVFRVLDCKHPTCRAIAWKDLHTPFVLCQACREHFDTVRRGLTAAQVGFDDTQVFARGLDYYTRTVFEVRAEGLGAQDAVAAGGRYDHLVEELGGPSVGAVGFAAGIERILLAAHPTVADTPPSRQGVYLAIAQPGLVDQAFALVQQLRHNGVLARMDSDGKSLKAQLREADKMGCRAVAVFGEQELQQGTINVKDLERGTQHTIPLESFAAALAKELKPTCHV